MDRHAKNRTGGAGLGSQRVVSICFGISFSMWLPRLLRNTPHNGRLRAARLREFLFGVGGAALAPVRLFRNTRKTGRGTAPFALHESAGHVMNGPLFLFAHIFIRAFLFTRNGPDRPVRSFRLPQMGVEDGVVLYDSLVVSCGRIASSRC